MQIGQEFAGIKSGKIKIKIKRESYITLSNREKVILYLCKFPQLHKTTSEVLYMHPWEWLSLIEDTKKPECNVGVAAVTSLAAASQKQADYVNQVNQITKGSKQVNHTIRLMTELEIRELAAQQKPSYFAKLKKKAYEKQLCSKEGHFWAMIERLSQEFNKKHPDENTLKLFTMFAKCGQREWEIEKLQSSLNAKCPVCGSKDFVFAENGNQKGFVCLPCLKESGQVHFIAYVSIENDIIEWSNRVTLGMGNLIPNRLCARCGQTFRWYSSDEWEGWLCSDCGEEFYPWDGLSTSEDI
ncbi:hypothetical protein [Caldicellulosiruptor morganii]|uniref:Uncharacterized protein n=1 Tax=Caldicellulosiruptor morganii TaxID=1387555 RepID=A0ABY7BSE4_9FIRM|nr:hypothetical protein [Caldicellulosiruptor morganii]WAM34509.1 hypothetical protein OTK00_000716 [Caldicellulosiruptor morganii]